MEEMIKRLAEATVALQQISAQAVAVQQETNRLLAEQIAALQTTVMQQARSVQEVGETPSNPRKAVQQALQKMTPADSVEAYLSLFERIATREGLPEVHWADVLAPFLIGESQQAYFDLAPESACVYTQLKTEILARMIVTVTLRANRFHAWRYDQAKPARAQLFALLRLLKDWLQPERLSPQQIVERVALDHFVHGLPKGLYRWVTRTEPQTLDEMAAAVERYTCAEGLSGDPAATREPCRGTRMFTDTRPVSARVRATHNKSTTATNPPGNFPLERGPRDMRCWTCHQLGHLAAQCPNREEPMECDVSRHRFLYSYAPCVSTSVKPHERVVHVNGAVKDEGTDWSLSDDQESTNFTSSVVKNESTDDSLSDSNENSNNQPEAEISASLTDSWEDVNDPPMPQIKDVWSVSGPEWSETCQGADLPPISRPQLDSVSTPVDDSIHEENTIPPFLERSDLVTDCVEDVNEHSPMPMDSDVTTDSIQEENADPPFLERSDLVTAEDITDTEESSGDLPSQVHKEVFYVACGNKKGLFLKSKWKGDTSGDICIRSEEELFTVTEFERFGGKASSRNWKKTIKCEGVTLEALMRRGILEPSPSRRKRRSKPHWKKSSVVKGEKSRKLSSCHENDFLYSDDKQNQCESQNESPDAHTE